MTVKKDIAVAMLKAHALREESYVKMEGDLVGRYTISWQTVCTAACANDPELFEVVYTMVTNGGMEGWAWAEKMTAE